MTSTSPIDPSPAAGAASVRSAERRAFGLVALLAWALFAFAGAYRWVQVPILGAAVLLALVVRPRVAEAATRTLDLGLMACLVAGALQLVPLSPAARQVLSPAAPVVDDALRIGPAVPTAQGTSLDPHLTAWALATATGLVFTFWTARALFAGGGLRLVLRGLTVCGLGLAAITFVQRGRTPHLIYGFWEPVTRTSTPTPLGPFVNRNDLATWLLLALPLVGGYAFARLHARSHRWTHRSLWRRLESVDVWGATLAASITLMAAALVACLSRSGLMGAVAGLMTLTLLARIRVGTSRSLLVVAAGSTALVVALQYTNLSALAFRLGEALPADVQGRWMIWQSSWQMARDFVVTGVGLGAFERGMLVYQPGPREVFFNHAHNEYLQLFTEGGLLVGVPLVWTIAVASRQAMRHLQADRSATFWIRAGGLSGMTAVAVQSLSDTGLRMPASGVLFAVAAAAVLHANPPPATTGGARRSARGHGHNVQIGGDRAANIAEPFEPLRKP